MTQKTKRRGRPVGTDYKQDEIALKLVAERMLAEPSLKPTQAMRGVFNTGAFSGRGYTQEDATLARWLVKWQTTGKAALEAAQERRDRQSRPAASSPSVSVAIATGHYLPAPPSADLLRRMDSASRAIEQFEKSGGRAALEAARDLIRNNATARVAAGFPSYPTILEIPGQSSLGLAVNSAKAAMRALEAAGGASHLREMSRLVDTAKKLRGF